MKAFLNKNWHIIALLAILAACGYLYYALASAAPSKAPAQSAAANSMAGMNMGAAPGTQYTVSFTTVPAHVLPGQETKLSFKIFDASNGAPVTDYLISMEKLMHLVIVDSKLDYFDHIHPAQNGSEFTIDTVFPHDDTYRLYITFQPNGGPEQQLAFSLPVGNGAPSVATIPVDGNLTKTFGGTTVAMSTEDGGPLSAAALTNMAQIVNFHFTDAKTGQPIADLKPYLGSMGHLVMINEKTYQYIHVHPVETESVLGGPDVQFLPMPLFGSIDPGAYRVFAQFNRNDTVFTADFTVQINP